MKKLLIGALVLVVGFGFCVTSNTADTKANENGPTPRLCTSPYCWGA